MKDKIVYRFLARLLVGLFIFILLGMWLDKRFNTTPWIMIALIIYVVVGSLYLLVRESK